jgi:hypothetical protein
MTISDALLVAVVGLAAAALGFVVRSRREDHYRFVDVKRERYADFLRFVNEHMVSLRTHVAAQLHYWGHDREDQDIPRIGTTDHLESLAWEIVMLSPDVGRQAFVVRDSLSEADADVRYAIAHPPLTAAEGSLRERFEAALEGGLEPVGYARNQFVRLALADLGTGPSQLPLRLRDAAKRLRDNAMAPIRRRRKYLPDDD